MEDTGKTKDELLHDIFASRFRTKMGEPIEFSSDVDLVIIQRRAAEKMFLTEDEYDENHYQRPRKAAQELFNQLVDQSCISFWLELTKVIKKHCIESDEENHACFKNMGKDVGDKPEKHFEAMFDKIVKEE